MVKVGKRSEQFDPFEEPKRRPVGGASTMEGIAGQLAELERAPVEEAFETAREPQEEPRAARPRPSGGGVPAKNGKTLGVSDAEQRLTQGKRFKTTRQESAQIESAAARLSAEVGARVGYARMTRALWDLYLRYEEDILRQIPAGSVWERPSNTDAVELAKLDARLSELMAQGFSVASRRANRTR